MEIRAGTEKDLSELIIMGKQLWPDQDRSELKEGFDTTFESSKEITFIGELDGAPIGFAICSVRSDYVEGSDGSPTGYLEAIFILPEYRNKGLASALVKQGEDWCRKHGCKQMGSDTEIDNQVSQHFHKSLGFKESNRIVCFIKKLSKGLDPNRVHEINGPSY